jgi:hypothetical protein
MNRWAPIVGIAGLIGCAIGLLFAAHAALAAWLVAWLAWGSIPIGALAVLMLVALIPGTWRALYAEPLTIGASLMPLVLIGVIPLLIGIDLIYPWTRPEVASTLSGFKGLWLSSSFFIIRNLIFILILSGLSWALIAAAPKSRAIIAAVGVLAYGLIGSLIGIDFAESTEPRFHSSIYGLIALTNQWLAGISFAILVGLWRTKGRAPRSAAGVLVTAILLWGYMHAMQYIVIWSGDIPNEARWYLERGNGLWWALAWTVFGLQGFIPFAALLSPAVRRSGKAMVVLAGLTLAMRLAENAWLVLPGLSGIGWAVAPLIVAASAAMLGCGWWAATWTRRAERWNERGWVSETRSI